MKLSLQIPLLFSGNPLAAQQQAEVLATAPLRYNKLNEGSGSAIVDSSGNGYTGTYTGVTWDGTVSPFGEVVPFWDGSADYGNLHSAAFGTAFNFDEVTIMCWFKVAAAFWTDGAGHTLLNFTRDANNFMRLRKPTTNNTLSFERTANSTAKNVTVGSLSYTTFTSVAYSASVVGGGLLAAGESRAYINGVQVGSTQTGNVAAAGSGLSATQTLLGAFNTTPTLVHTGYLAQVIVWNSPMDAAKLALMT